MPVPAVRRQRGLAQPWASSGCSRAAETGKEYMGSGTEPCGVRLGQLSRPWGQGAGGRAGHEGSQQNDVEAPLLLERCDDVSLQRSE